MIDSAATPSTPFECYLQVRERMRAMQQVQPAAATLTKPQLQLLAGLAPLWEASADQIKDLRSISKLLTGVRRSHYKGEHAEGLLRRLERDLERLTEKGDVDLLVGEPRALGGYGFQAFGRVYNEDTLRFFRVISILRDAALIKDLRRGTPRPTVWDIGGGWGGLAYQVKTLCPNVTYLITAPPELLLVSSVYLLTLFPNASARFYDPARPDAFWQEWEQVDFAFAPDGVVSGLRPPRLELTIDFMALDAMTAARIEQHVRTAYELGCRYFLTVCPDGEFDPEMTTPVEPIVDRWYWPHPVSTAAGLKKRLALGEPRGRAISRTYRLGWRRLRV